MNIIATSQNKSGLVYGLVRHKDGRALVAVLKTNYSLGKNVKRWVFCSKHKQSGQDFQRMVREGLPFEEAYQIYLKKLDGKKRY